MRMKSKTVIITGGGKGIGFGVATAFAKEGADIGDHRTSGIRAGGRERKIRIGLRDPRRGMSPAISAGRNRAESRR